MEFKDFDLRAEVQEGIEAMGYKDPTPIQVQGIPTILSGRDLIGCAQTGTGKTAAFLIPLINRLSGTNSDKIRCLVIVPTRELAVQIDQQLDGFSYFCPISSISIYGGNQATNFDAQKNAIVTGADILISTPGRLIAHMNLGYVDLSTVETLILDEADRMLDMGFIDDITKIVNEMPKKRQTLMFSATMAPKIRQLAKKILNDPAQITLAVAKPVEGVRQVSYMVYNPNKIKLLAHIIKNSNVQNMIIFAARKISVDDIFYALLKQGIDVKNMHSGKDQDERNEIMRLFKAGKIKILVATDVLSRGIDVDGLSHVLNYDIPSDAADYVHRVGRTARADKSGEAISFVNEEDQIKLVAIEELIEKKIDKLDTPKEIGNSPQFEPEKNRHLGGRGRFQGNKGKWRGNPNKKRHGGNKGRQGGGRSNQGK